MADYKIAGIVMHVSWHDRGKRHLYYRSHDCVVMPRSMRAFQMYEEEPEKIDIEVLVKTVEPFVMPKQVKRVGHLLCYMDGKDQVISIFTDYENPLPGYSVRINEDYTYAELIPHRVECQTFDLQRAQYVFEGRLLLEGGFVLHGAAVEWNGKGIIFTGLSGAGKSTQAHLWQEYEQAFIINGDCPALTKTEEGTFMNGTPWCGSSGEYLNRRTKVAAIVSVKQAKENRVRYLEGTEKMMTILSQVFRSNIDAKMLDYAIANVMHCIDDFVVLELQCTKDQEAVQVLKREL